MDKIVLTNFWLRRKKQPDLIRIVQWAQWNKIKVENMTEDDIINALKSRAPDQDENFEVS